MQRIAANYPGVSANLDGANLTLSCAHNSLAYLESVCAAELATEVAAQATKGQRAGLYDYLLGC